MTVISDPPQSLVKYGLMVWAYAFALPYVFFALVPAVSIVHSAGLTSLIWATALGVPLLLPAIPAAMILSRWTRTRADRSVGRPDVVGVQLVGVLIGSLSMCIVGLPAGLAIYQLAVGSGESPSSAVVVGFAYFVIFLQGVVWMPAVSGVCGAFVAREGWRRANERRAAQQ